MGQRGVIAAGDPQTAEAGAVALRAGGNAIDAVCAAAFASFVVEGPLGSPAGGGVLLHGGADAPFEVLDFFAVTPGRGLASRPELDFHGITVDFGPTEQVFHVGRGSAAVPTAVFGLLDAHRRAGRLPLSEVVAPAVALGRHGFTLQPAVQWVFRLLTPILTLSPGVRALYCKGDRIAGAGERLDNRPLADFLELLAVEGEALLRGPFTAALLREFGPDRGGLLTEADLVDYRPVRRRPLEVPFGDDRVLLNPPPSSGGALVALGLRLAERAGLDRAPFLSAAHLSAMASVLGTVSDARIAGIDDAVHDPEAVAAWLSEASVDGWAGRLEALRTERALGSTTHISVLDAEGHAASLTMSNGEGSGHTLPELGIHVNNFLGEEDINPGGFHRQPPGAWMTTMMCPTVVVRDGRPRLVLGSGGSNRIRSAVLQALVNVLAFERPLTDAVNTPRMHVEGRRLWFERWGLDRDAADALAGQWPEHAAFDAPNMFFGGVHAAAAPLSGALTGAGDRRRGGTVVVG